MLIQRPKDILRSFLIIIKTAVKTVEVLIKISFYILIIEYTERENIYEKENMAI